MNKKSFQCYQGNYGLLIFLQKGNLESLLKNADELEKRYEWLQAAESYKKASEILLKENDFVNAAELTDRLGYCYFKAADQAETNKEYREHMKQTVDAFKKELEILEAIEVENMQIRITHAQALIAYVDAMLERRLLEKKKLLNEWWILENKVLTAYEKSGDLGSAGKVCNEVLDYSRSNRFWLASNHSEYQQNIKEYTNLAEKAIQIFSKLNDEYNLARAYFLATFYYSYNIGNVGSKFEEFRQKSQEYSKNALDLSKKIGDPYLIGASLSSLGWDAKQDTIRNPKLMIENYNNAIKYGKIAKNYMVITPGKLMLAYLLNHQVNVLEDPFEQKENLKKAIKLLQETKSWSEATENIVTSWVFYRDYIHSINNLASIETDPKTKQDLLELAIKANQEGIKRLQGWKFLSGSLLGSMGTSLQLISKTKSEVEEKRRLLQKAKHYRKKSLTYGKEMFPFRYVMIAYLYFELATVDNDLATIETENKLKIRLLKDAVTSIEKANAIVEKMRFFGLRGKFYDLLGNLLVQINLVSEKGNTILNAINSYQKASLNFEKAEMPSHQAESHWHMAQLHDNLGEYQKASKNYEMATQAFDLSSKKIPQLSEFYSSYSKYMRAWSQIEQAKYSHSIEDYTKAKEHYENAANLHELTEPWGYLAANYCAWANIEEAESLSRTENAQQARQKFQKAYEKFCNSEESIKQKLEEITSTDEKEMTEKLFEASGLRRKYCQARMLMEEAKLLDRQGKYLPSSKSYEEAAQNFSAIAETIAVEAERKELEYLAILCRAWEKMAHGEETSSSEPYLEAAELFEKAKELCLTQKASLWALGNSNFCRGLAAGIQYQTSLGHKEHEKAKTFMKTASTNYLKAGFKAASEYAKATQRLFDAYLFMNQAETEVDQGKRAKQYQMAENLLQIAAGSFMKAKQPEKTVQVKAILANVREEKALAVSLSQLMQTPTIATSTPSFVAPTSNSEVSVGLEKFEHANVQANLVSSVKQVKIGESFSLSAEFVNAGREPALLMRVDDFVPQDFVVVKKPEIYRIEENTLNMKGKQLAPLKLVEVKLTVQPSKKGHYHLNPRVHYLDELGQNKSLQLRTVEINVEEIIMEDRVSTGTEELDSLLLGGIPNEYAVVLSGPPCDERELLIKNFLKAGAKEEFTFYIVTEVVGLEGLLKNPNFYLFLCNPKPKIEVPDFPNVYRLQSKTDLTNLSIALTKAIRNIDQSITNKRICIEILSDVLVKHGTNTSKEWISGLITDLGAKGFTILAVMDPKEHPLDQATTVLNLFDGEISITQSDDPLDCKKSITVKKLRNQDYIKNPICLR